MLRYLNPVIFIAKRKKLPLDFNDYFASDRQVISLLLPTIAPIWMEVFLISKIMNHPKSSTVLRISDAALL